MGIRTGFDVSFDFWSIMGKDGAYLDAAALA
jgi:hypothetical protein